MSIAQMVAMPRNNPCGGKSPLVEAFLAAVDCSCDWEMWLSPDGELCYCSPACATMTGHAAEEFMANPALLLEVVHPDDRVAFARHFRRHCLGGGADAAIEVRMIGKDGQSVWVEHRCRAVRSAAGERLGRRVSNRDITSRKNRELELAAAESRAREACATKGYCLSVLSHDMRAPLCNIFNLLETGALDDCDDATRRRLSNVLRRETFYARELLENLLAWIGSQKERISVFPEVIELQELVGGVIDDFLNVAVAKGIRLESRIAGELRLDADRQMVATILRNLISNAIKFTAQGGVSVFAEEEEGLVHVRVQDSGVGIAASRQPNLLAQGMSNSTCGTNNEKGLGLGLSICESFAKHNGGRVWFESVPKRGSCFHFTLRSARVENRARRSVPA